MLSLQLYDLKQSLVSITAEHKRHAGIKFHALFHHFGTSALNFGAPYFLDTVCFEHAHIKDGIAAWSRTSKRKTGQTKEMTCSLGKRRFSDMIEMSFEDSDKYMLIITSLYAH